MHTVLALAHASLHKLKRRRCQCQNRTCAAETLATLPSPVLQPEAQLAVRPCATVAAPAPCSCRAYETQLSPASHSSSQAGVAGWPDVAWQDARCSSPTALLCQQSLALSPHECALLVPGRYAHGVSSLAQAQQEESLPLAHCGKTQFWVLRHMPLAPSQQPAPDEVVHWRSCVCKQEWHARWCDTVSHMLLEQRICDVVREIVC